MKNIIQVGNRSKNIPSKVQNPFKRHATRFMCYWSISVPLDPDAHCQYGSGSRTAKSMRIGIHDTAVKLRRSTQEPNKEILARPRKEIYRRSKHHEICVNIN
jgi:hypothetical protein